MSSPDRPESSRDLPLGSPEEPSATQPTGGDDIDGAAGVGGVEERTQTPPRLSATAAEATAVDDDTPLLVIGGGQVGRLLASRLYPGRPVHYIDSDATAVDRAARRHDATFVADLTDGSALAAVAADVGTAGVDVVVATPQDATNLLVAQHCRASLEASRVLVVVADPRAHDVYPPAFERVCATTALTDAVVSTLAEPIADESD